jgi:hypothetical protein
MNINPGLERHHFSMLRSCGSLVRGSKDRFVGLGNVLLLKSHEYIPIRVWFHFVAVQAIPKYLGCHG